MSLPPFLFFSLLFTYFPFCRPFIRCLCVLSVGAWVMCFLPSVSSHTASLVCLAPPRPSLYGVFWLCFECWSEHVFVCLFFKIIYHHCQPVYLTLFVFHVSLLLLVVCLLASFPLLSSNNFQTYFPFRFHFRSLALCLHALVFSPVTAFIFAS